MTYKIQIDDKVRDATPEEIEIIKNREAEALKKQAESEAKTLQKTALLNKLGISEDEFKLLLN